MFPDVCKHPNPFDGGGGGGFDLVHNRCARELLFGVAIPGLFLLTALVVYRLVRYLQRNTTSDFKQHSADSFDSASSSVVLPTFDRTINVGKLVGSVVQMWICFHWYQYRVSRDSDDIAGGGGGGGQRALFYIIRPVADAILWAFVAVALAGPNALCRYYRSGRWVSDAFYCVSMVCGCVELYVVYIMNARDNVQDRHHLLTSVGASTLLAVLAFATPHHYHGDHLDAGIVVPEGSGITPSAGAEQSASWFSMFFFTWLNPLFALGVTRRIDSKDIPHLLSQDLAINAWKRYHAVRNPSRGLIWNLFLTERSRLFVEMAASTFEMPMRFAQPWLLQQIVRYLQDPTSMSRNQAYVFVFGMLVSGIVQAALMQFVFFQNSKMEIHIRGILGMELNTKAIRRPGKGVPANSSDSTQDNSANDADDGDDEDGEDGEEGLATDGQLLNLISTDVQRIVGAVQALDWSWEAPVILVIGIYYMYSILGLAAFAGLGVLVLSYPTTMWMFSWADYYLNKVNLWSDKRMAMINEMLQGIRIIKMFGWSDRFIANITAARNRQLHYLSKIYQLWTAVFTMNGTVPILIVLASFGTHTLVLGNVLTADQAFTYVAVVRIVRQVCDYFPAYIREVITALASVRRVERFLAQPDCEPLEERVVVAAADDGDIGSGVAVALVGACFEWQTEQPVDPEASTVIDDGMSIASVSTSGSVTPDVYSDGESVATDMSAVNAELLHVTAKSTSNRKKRHFRLRNINLAFPAGKLSIIGGAVGCGKTSLLLALLGEMRHTGGHIHIPIQTLDSAGNSSSGGGGGDGAGNSSSGGGGGDGADMLDGAPRIRDVAYVAQEAWLRAGTIHDNILFGLPYDADRYHAVIRMCGLEPDLRVLKGGHFTEVGANGVVLSGGQKQRLALARAVYSRAQILLLDDCLSAVDSHTAKHILNECLTNFESPIIAGRTIVLVTHHINLCLHSAAYVVCMKNGRVTAVGTPDEVLASGKLAAITDLVSNAPSRSGSHEADSSTVTPEATAAVTPSTSADNAPALGSATAAQDGKLVEEEERGVGALKMDVVKLYVNSARGGAVAWVCIMLSYSVTQFITTLSDYWTRVWVDATDSGVVRPSLYYMCGYAAIALLFFIVKFSQWTLVSKVHIASVRSIHEQLLHRIARATPRFFDQTPSGRVTIRFGKDMTRTDEALADQLTWFVHALCAALGSLFVVAYVTPMFLVLALLIAGAYCYLGYYFLATTRELKRLDAVSNAPILSIFSEMLRGATTIRAFGAQDQLLLESLDHLDALNRPLWFIWATNRWLSIRVICLGSFVSFFAAFLIMFSADALGPGLAGLSLSYALAFSMDAMWAVRIYGLTELNFNFVERIQQYLNIDQEAPAIIKDNRPPASWPHAGRVDVRDLVVEYKPGVPVLHGLTFSTKPGERVGIIGKTGSGKSTTALALLRVVEAAHGSIEIDGIDISTIGLDDLRRSVSIIPQDPVLFNGTVRSNLDPFDEHDDTVLWEALRRSHLVKDPNRVPTSVAVSAVPTAAGGGDGDGGDEAQLAEEDDDVFHDLEEQITENGGNLSLGQRQLVSIARALVRRSRIVILDEASSSIDFKTDELVQDTIRSELAGVSTIFTIAHRLKTIADYDRVMVLDKGQIMEFDKPSKLLATEGSAFRGMCMASGEFELLVNIANGVNITESSH